MLSVSKIKPGQKVFVRDFLSGEKEYEFHSYERPRYRGDKGKVWLVDLETVSGAPQYKDLCYLTLHEFRQRGRLPCH